MPPHGSLPPSAYWRRRLLILSTIALAGLTGYVLFIANRDKEHPSGQQSTTSVARQTPESSAGSTGTPVTCVPAVLGVAAATPVRSYRVGQQVDLQIRVTNIGQRPCLVDLSDRQIEMLVYNGESRVWGSHDCKVQPGHSTMTLAPRNSALRTIRWTGLSSRPRCAGTRMRVGAGTYTLRARFGQAAGRTATFNLS